MAYLDTGEWMKKDAVEPCVPVSCSGQSPVHTSEVEWRLTAKDSALWSDIGLMVHDQRELSYFGGEG